ncbi:hypothetical protein DPX16_0072, partial [Anabarilius grahami]
RPKRRRRKTKPAKFPECSALVRPEFRECSASAQPEFPEFSASVQPKFPEFSVPVKSKFPEFSASVQPKPPVKPAAMQTKSSEFPATEPAPVPVGLLIEFEGMNWIPSPDSSPAIHKPASIFSEPAPTASESPLAAANESRAPTPRPCSFT